MIVAVADTHAVLWYIFANANLSKSAKIFIDTAAQEGNQVAVSSITPIEMVYLIEKGRIAAESLSRLANELADPDSVFVEIPIDIRIARALARVDVVQVPDMPDRIIAAAAVHLNVPVISRDGKIKMSDIKTIW